MKNKIKYLKDYKISSYKIEKTNLLFDLYDNHVLVESKVVYYKNLESKEGNKLELNWEFLELISIHLDEKELIGWDYEKNEWTLIIKNTPDKFILTIKTKIFPSKNTSLEWLYMSNWKFCTQCESEGFRRITYYLDRPDIMSVFTTKIVASKDKYPVLLSNWNKISQWDIDNKRHFVTWEDPFKKPSYLFALVAWKLENIEDEYITMSWKKVTLKIFTESHNIHKCKFAMDSLKRAMKWDEDKFWLEYDLDLFMIVAVDDFNAGAMENKWLNIFNSKLVFATPKSATDNDYISIEAVIWHEYFHNWTWDRVTCRDWFQLSLKEWLTVFRDSEFTSDMQSRSVKRIEDVRFLRSNQFREDSGPMSHPIRPSSFEEISNFYTVTVYEKWAEVVRMYKTILWVDWFRKWMDLYFKRHDWEAVTTEDFLTAMWDANSKDLSQFSSWYNQAWTPVVEVESSYNESTNTYKLDFIQSCPETPESKNKKPFIIPIKIWLLTNSWEEFKIENDLILLTKEKQSFEFKNIKEKVTPSLLRWFSAPIRLNYNYTYIDYAFLMKNDNDYFNRFEASQNFAKDIIIENLSSNEKVIDNTFLESLRSILEDKKLENSFKAEVLILPSEVEIADIVWVWVNPSKIHEVREFFINKISVELKDILEEIYNKLNINIDYKVNSKDIWDRKLKNSCLIYLSYIYWANLAYDQYKNSNNMTDKLASLTCLSNIDCEERKECLNDFYEEWKDDTNVIDKWFTIQAISNLDNTLDTIKKLCNNDLFDIKNPNKTRALFNSFSVSNPYIFNKKDGSWYEFIADKVIILDKINPMIASRLAKTLINWKSLDLIFQDKLKDQLIRISKTSDLSKDLSEVINKSLV